MTLGTKLPTIIMIDLRHFGNVGLEFFGKFSLVDTFIKEYLC